MASKSLEALERIETVFVYNKQIKKNCYADFMSESKVIEEYYKDYNTIKQDLERLEQLEKENQELKGKLSKFENPILYMCRTRASKDFERMRLIGLATTLNVPIILEDTETLKEKHKLKKAIDILKSNLYIEFNDSYNGVSFKKDKYDECDYTVLCLNLKSQYDLLKEMLGNEMVQK